MIRKRTSKLLRLQSQPESPLTSRPPSRAAPSPRTLVMSNADLWFSEPEEKPGELTFEPTFPQILEESEPLFHDSFLSKSFNHELQFPHDVTKYRSSSSVSFGSDVDLSSDEYEDTVEELDFDTASIASSEASIAISITMFNVGKPKLIDVSPSSSIADPESPYIHSRQLSTSSRSSSTYSENHGSTFSHHSASSSTSDCTQPSQPHSPMTLTAKSSRRSSTFKPEIPPRSHSKRFSAQLNKLSRNPQETKISRLSWNATDDYSTDTYTHGQFYTDEQGLVWSFPSIPGEFRD